MHSPSASGKGKSVRFALIVCFAVWGPAALADDFTKLLLHLDDAGTNILDSSCQPKAIAVFGSTTQTTTTAKFGDRSAYFDGSGDYFHVYNSSNTADFNFGSGDFTIDFWLYPLYTANQLVFDMWSGSGGSVVAFCIQHYNSSKINFYNGNSTIINTGVSVSWGQWSHYAIVRYGNVVTLYCNGTSIYSGAFSGLVSSHLCEPSQCLLQGVH